MDGWELKDASLSLVEDEAGLQEFLSRYALAGVNQDRNILAIIRRCEPGLNAPPKGSRLDWQLYLFFSGGWTRFALPDGVCFREIEVEGRTIAISTDQGRVLTNPAELNQLNQSTDAESLRATFFALCNRLPAPVRPITQTSICSEVLGEMVQDSFDDWWRGKDLEIPFFDGQSLPVIFMDLNPDQDRAFAGEADEVLRSFLLKTCGDRLAESALVYANCQEFIEAVGVDDGNQAMADLRDPREIWRFVKPQTIYLSRRRRRDPSIYLQISCHCDWEEEHGLQLVFWRGQRLVRVSPEDGHLTESDAYDQPDEEDSLLWAVLARRS